MPDYMYVVRDIAWFAGTATQYCHRSARRPLKTKGQRNKCTLAVEAIIS